MKPTYKLKIFIIKYYILNNMDNINLKTSSKIVNINILEMCINTFVQKNTNGFIQFELFKYTAKYDNFVLI